MPAPDSKPREEPMRPKRDPWLIAAALAYAVNLIGWAAYFILHR